MVRFDHAVFGGDTGSLDQRKQITLNALPGNFCTMTIASRCDLVDLIQKNNTVLLEHLQCPCFDRLFVDQFGGLFVGGKFHRLTDLQFAGMPFCLAQLAKHSAQLLSHVFHAGRAHYFHGLRQACKLHFNFTLGQQPFPQFLSEYLASDTFCTTRKLGICQLTARSRQQNIQNPLFGRIFGFAAHFAHFLNAGLFHSNVCQIADDRIHIFANITHLGKFGGFNLDEWGICQPGQPTRDFSFTNTSRPNHQDIFGGNFLTQARLHLLAAPAIAQSYRHRPFGLRLADDVFVQFQDDFLWLHNRQVFIT